MNYRHAYHAGNHTDVFKHAVLVMLLEYLRRKDSAFVVLDTHAGAGRYDLRSPEAEKTGEAEDGIGRVLAKPLPSAVAYLDLIRAMNPDGLAVYPGSPAIVAAFLRDIDRLIACDLHDEEAAKLRRAFRGDDRIAVHHRDGYEAIKAFLPLRRGLVFIDPPYEKDDPDAYKRLARRLNAGLARWPGGMFAAWYPLKERAGIDQVRKAYDQANPPTLAVEFLRVPMDGTTFAGSGMLIANPPYGIETRLRALGKDLADAFAAPRARLDVAWWIPET
jgi:23S rRNA (adenine2030-N6)-methyltransferase